MQSDGNAPRFLLLCGVLAPVMMVAVILVVGQITPDYDPVSETVSQMGAAARPYAFVLNAGYVAYGILMGVAAYGLSHSMGLTARARILAVLLGIHAAGTMLLGVFPDTLDLAPKGLADDFLHNSVSAVSSLPLLVGILVLRGIARQRRTLKAAGILGMIVIIVNLPMPAIPMLDALQPVSGLLQRLLSGSAFLWLALTFGLLYRVAARSEAGAGYGALAQGARGEPAETSERARLATVGVVLSNNRQTRWPKGGRVGESTLNEPEGRKYPTGESDASDFRGRCRHLQFRE